MTLDGIQMNQVIGIFRVARWECGIGRSRVAIVGTRFWFPKLTIDPAVTPFGPAAQSKDMQCLDRRLLDGFIGTETFHPLFQELDSGFDRKGAGLNGIGTAGAVQIIEHQQRVDRGEVGIGVDVGGERLGCHAGDRISTLIQLIDHH